MPGKAHIKKRADIEPRSFCCVDYWSNHLFAAPPANDRRALKAFSNVKINEPISIQQSNKETPEGNLSFILFIVHLRRRKKHFTNRRNKKKVCLHWFEFLAMSRFPVIALNRISIHLFRLLLLLFRKRFLHHCCEFQNNLPTANFLLPLQNSNSTQLNWSKATKKFFFQRWLSNNDSRIWMAWGFLAPFWADRVCFAERRVARYSFFKSLTGMNLPKRID